MPISVVNGETIAGVGELCLNLRGCDVNAYMAGENILMLTEEVNGLRITISYHGDGQPYTIWIATREDDQNLLTPYRIIKTHHCDSVHYVDLIVRQWWQDCKLLLGLG